MNRFSAEDFAQFATLAVFTGRKTSTKNLFCDFMREEFGRNDAHENLEKTKVKKPWQAGAMIEDVEDCKIQDLDLRIATRLKHLDMAERVITILILGWGFTQREVAEVMGVSESRISQIISVVYNKFEVDFLDENA